MKTLYESILDLNPESEIEDDIDIFDLILKSKNREEFNERLDMLESIGEPHKLPNHILNKNTKDVYFYVITNDMGKNHVYKHLRIGMNGKAWSVNMFKEKNPFISWESWSSMLQDDEKYRLPDQYRKFYKKYFRY